MGRFDHCGIVNELNTGSIYELCGIRGLDYICFLVQRNCLASSWRALVHVFCSTGCSRKIAIVCIVECCAVLSYI